MSTSFLYHTQGIRDYDHVSFAYQKGILVWNIERKSHCCPHCGSPDVSVCKRGRRIVTGLPVGGLRTWIVLTCTTSTAVPAVPWERSAFRIIIKLMELPCVTFWKATPPLSSRRCVPSWS